MSAHDRFEILSGAVMLGEATPQERETFAAHAATCAQCGDDAGAGAFVTERVAEAHRSETWRPSQPIVERIRARRSTRSRFTLGALGWGVALSLVLNVALAGGIGSRLIGAFQARTEAPVASSAISLDAPHVAAVVSQPVRHKVVAFADAAPKRHVHRFAHPHAAVKKPAARPAEQKLPTLDDIPDVLAGVDLYGTGSAHPHVAVETLPRCKPDDATGGADVHPCRDANGRVER